MNDLYFIINILQTSHLESLSENCFRLIQKYFKDTTFIFLNIFVLSFKLDSIQLIASFAE